MHVLTTKDPRFLGDSSSVDFTGCNPYQSSHLPLPTPSQQSEDPQLSPIPSESVNRNRFTPNATPPIRSSLVDPLPNPGSESLSMVCFGMVGETFYISLFVFFLLRDVYQAPHRAPAAVKYLLAFELKVGFVCWHIIGSSLYRKPTISFLGHTCQRFLQNGIGVYAYNQIFTMEDQVIFRHFSQCIRGPDMLNRFMMYERK